MTNEEMIQDFKQFITATVSQQTAQLEQRMDSIEQRIDGVEQRMATKDDLRVLRTELKGDIETLFDEKLDLIQDAIAETLDDVTTAKIEEHEQRWHHLKRRAA